MIDIMIGAAVLLLLLLAAYATYLVVQVRRRESSNEQRLAELDLWVGEQQEKRINSIRILAQAVLEGQITSTEAAIRIAALLDILGQGEVARQNYPAIYHLADETQHIPRLEAWSALTRKERKQYTFAREASEVKYKEFVMQCAEKLRNFDVSAK